MANRRFHLPPRTAPLMSPGNFVAGHGRCRGLLLADVSDLAELRRIAADPGESPIVRTAAAKLARARTMEEIGHG